MLGRAQEQQVPEKVDYHLWEMVERVANLFRIYPTERRLRSACERTCAPHDLAQYTKLRKFQLISLRHFNVGKYY